MTVPLLGGVEIKVDGRPLPPTVDVRLQEARVDLHARLPDCCSLRIIDPKLELIDRSFGLGSDLEVAFTRPEGSGPVTVFDGLVASLEPEFGQHTATLLVRGYDRSHKLNQTRRSDAWENVSYSDIARTLARSGGLVAGQIDTSGAPLPFVQQSNETNWEFLWRMADEIGFEVHVSGRKLDFRRAGRAAARSPVRLVWGGALLAFRPRATAVQQVDGVTVRGWDPATKRTIEATARPSQTGASIGIRRSQAVSALGGGTTTVADRPVHTSAQASAMARSVADRLGETFVEAEGTAEGNPALVPGAKIQVEGAGKRFAGTYTLSSATHVLRARGGYETRFAITGRASRSMLELAGGRREPSWRHSVVVGLVTNNQDPSGLGRVRVRYPVLGPSHEGWWARVTAPAAGARRGLLMTPQPGDEVLLAFEHGHEEHPYVVGSVWNGTAKPEELVHADGSFALRSDKQVLLEAAEAMTFTGDKDFTVSAAGNAKVTTTEREGEGAPGNVLLDAKGQATMKSGTSAKVQAGTDAAVTASTEIKIAAGTELTIEGAGQVKIVGASVQIEGSGMVQISGAQVMLG
jgi:phage protein D